MELKPGYKQTEVGAIPEEWESTSVTAVASASRNSIVGGPFGSDLVSRDYVDQGVPVIRGQNMGGQWVSGSFVFVSPAKAVSLEANLARSGDIVFTQRGTLGQVALVPDLPYPRYLVSQSQMKLSVSRDIADPLFFYYLFSGEQQQDYIRKSTIQTGVPHINLSTLRSIPVPRPPLPEQRAIARALDDVDALLGALTQLIAKKRDLKEAAMQQLLTGQTRLPGFCKPRHKRKQANVGAIPDDWNVAPLQSITLKIQDGTHFSPTMGGRDFLYVTSRNIGVGRLDVSDAERIDVTQHRQIYSRCDVRRGDVLLTKDGANTGNAALNTLDEEFSLLSSVAFLRFDSKEFIPAFFLYQILSSQGQQQIKELMSGNAITRLTLQKIRALCFAFPPPDEQTAIAAVLSDMDTEIAALEQRLAKTRALKQGMMQELLTGRTRLV